MNIDLVTFQLYIRELEDKLVDSRLQKIMQAAEDEYVFKFRMPGENYFLFLSLNPKDHRIHRVPGKFFKSQIPSAFCMALRKHIEGAKVLYVEAFPNDRVFQMVLSISRPGQDSDEKTLVFEMTGRNCNLILLDGGERFIHAYNRKDSRREIVTGQPYEKPISPAGINPFTIEKDRFLMILESERNVDRDVKEVLLKSYYGLVKAYVVEILFHSGIGVGTPLHNISSRQKETLFREWSQFFSKIANREVDPTLYYKEEDEDMEEEPVRYTPWEFDSLLKFPKEKLATIDDLLEAFYFKQTANRSIDDLKKELKKAVEKKIKKVAKRIEKQEKDFKGTERAEILKKFGELILGNIHRIEPKAKSVEVDDYYENPPVKTSIKLKPELSASDNAQDYFKRYKKAKRGHEKIAERLDISKEELEYLESLIFDVESAENLEDLVELGEILSAEGIYNLNLRRPGTKKQEKSGPRKYELAPGFVALVGRNSKQNEELSVRIAKRDDVWFHARQIPGSHVILRIQKPSQPVPDKVLYEAAQLAAFFSKAKTSSKVPVDYTLIKDVRKVKGQKAGKVFYVNEKTLMVKPGIPGLQGLSPSSKE